jgi:hypothetical protein
MAGSPLAPDGTSPAGPERGRNDEVRALPRSVPAADCRGTTATLRSEDGLIAELVADVADDRACEPAGGDAPKASPWPMHASHAAATVASAVLRTIAPIVRRFLLSGTAYFLVLVSSISVPTYSSGQSSPSKGQYSSLSSR